MASNVYDNFKNLLVDIDIITRFSERKHRYIDDRSNQQLLRVDENIVQEDDVSCEQQLEQIDYSVYDGIVISDYNKGLLSYVDIETIIHRSPVPVFIDTKKPDLARFDGAIVKINELEYNSRISDTDDLVVTHGGNYVEWKDSIFIPPKVDAHDVCGAGDTFLASLAYQYLSTEDMDKSIEFAMKAAAIAVRHTGVYAPTLKEIINE